MRGGRRGRRRGRGGGIPTREEGGGGGGGGRHEAATSAAEALDAKEACPAGVAEITPGVLEQEPAEKDGIIIKMILS